ncbi:DUF6415 family natural product biosynthesis protein [Streptomyces sp. GXMU-J15]|uniref:DUF6415 family natural product biosynthesis protein n=1 Tax=Streptomyces fuscus TaxID=3048495 RepID=A0ABT7ISJ1_9ACTN|nr:DUF6415 family natural product biosynthesis protein [Streptomyces fuscus]MDL2075057.1 DUF6415 family natural product biosynthesis protein [Streptomyces fuscus]
MNTTEETRATPVDIAAMRTVVAEVLPPEVTPTDPATLGRLIGLLRGHIERLIPEVEQAAAQRPVDDVPRYVALACVTEARGKLEAVPALLPYDMAAHARRLGRSLLALCDHYEALTDVRLCLACDRSIRPGEATRPYDQGSPSGGSTHSGRIHELCVNRVRYGVR